MFLYNDFKLATKELSKVLDLDLAPGSMDDLCYRKENLEGLA